METTVPTTTPAEDLEAADNAHTLAVQAAVSGHGDWAHVRQAAEVVRQCRSAFRNAGDRA